MEIKREEYKEFLTEDYLSLKEASQMLDISEEELKDLVKKHRIQTHQVAGAFTRLKKKEVEELKVKWRIERELFPKPDTYFPHQSAVEKGGLFDGIIDFWYFNDFYILCSILIALLLYVILSTQ